MKKEKRESPLACRRGKVGGQAVLEGVMMRCGERYSIASRLPDGSLHVQNHTVQSLRRKYKVLNLPILRGIIGFVESMILSFKTLSQSAEALGLEEEEETRFEKWLKRHFGKTLLNVVMAISTVLGVVLGIALFAYLPMLTVKGIEALCAHISGNAAFLLPSALKTVLEGLMKIGIFILYVWLVSFMRDIRRTYEYHGAEHKSIACYEAGDELTPENAARHTRFHPRCGTSFIFVMLILSILVYMFIPWGKLYLRFVLKLLLLPLVMGLGYEFLMYAGKHDGAVVRILSAPGLWMQRLTTREPSLDQLEVAIAALKASMPDEFPPEKPEAEEGSKNAEESALSPESGEATEAEKPDGSEKAE